MQSHQYDDDGKHLEVFSTVTPGFSTHSTVASGGTAASAVCCNSLPVSEQLSGLIVPELVACLRNDEQMPIPAQVVRECVYPLVMSGAKRI